MKPHIICHMGASIDGRIVPAHWPKGVRSALGEVYEHIHRELGGDAWIVGRVTMAEFAKGQPRPVTATERYPRETWKGPGAEQGPYAIALDQGGKLHLNIGKANGDPVIAVLTEAVSDDHLAELRRDGISYVFAGTAEIDLGRALDILAAEFGIGKLLLEGGGGINGGFLEAGLIDEISLLVFPVADGHSGLPTLFDHVKGEGRALTLLAADTLEGGVLHLRYKLA
jgi:riboflavin biosynthesis pyrimidine reductase